MTTPAERNQRIIVEFRANAGWVAALGDGPPLLLLTTAGAKSGRERVIPLRYLYDADRWVVFAGNRGEPGIPAWYYNVLAHPHATIEVGGDTIAVAAVIVTGPDRERLIARHAAAWPWWGTTVLARKQPHQLPVIALTRRA